MISTQTFLSIVNLYTRKGYSRGCQIFIPRDKMGILKIFVKRKPPNTSAGWLSRGVGGYKVELDSHIACLINKLAVRIQTQIQNRLINPDSDCVADMDVPNLRGWTKPHFNLTTLTDFD